MFDTSFSIFSSTKDILILPELEFFISIVQSANYQNVRQQMNSQVNISQQQSEIIETNSNYNIHEKSQIKKYRVSNDLFDFNIQKIRLVKEIKQYIFQKNNNNKKSQIHAAQNQMSGVQIDLNGYQQISTELTNNEELLSDNKVAKKEQVEDGLIYSNRDEVDPKQQQQSSSFRNYKHPNNSQYVYQQNQEQSVIKNLSSRQHNDNILIQQNEEYKQVKENYTQKLNTHNECVNQINQDKYKYYDQSHQNQYGQIYNDQNGSLNIESPLNQSQESQSSLDRDLYLYNLNYSLHINEYSQDFQYRYTFTLEIKDSLCPFDIAVDKSLIDQNEFTKEMICTLIKDALNTLECQEVGKLKSHIIDDAYMKWFYINYQLQLIVQNLISRKRKMIKRVYVEQTSTKLNQISPIKSSTVQFNLTPDEKNHGYSLNQVTTPCTGTITATQTLQDDINSQHELEEGEFYNEDSIDFNRQDDYQTQTQNTDYSQSQTYYQNNTSRQDSNHYRNEILFQQIPDPINFNSNHQQPDNATNSIQLNGLSGIQQIQQKNKQNLHHNQQQQPSIHHQSHQGNILESNPSKNYQVMPQNIQQISYFTTPQSFQNINPQTNFYYNKIIDSFISFYRQYWVLQQNKYTECNFDIMLNESQEMMKFRQLKEIIELQRLHIMQNDQWLQQQMIQTVFPLNLKQTNTQQVNMIYFQAEQGAINPSNHSVLHLSNISNVRDLDYDNYISPQLKDSIDIEFSNMFSDNLQINNLGSNNTKHFHSINQNSNYQINGNNYQPECIISPSNQSKGNQQTTMNIQGGELITNNKKYQMPVRPQTPNQQQVLPNMGETVSSKAHSQPSQKNQYAGLQQIQQQQSSQFNLNLQINTSGGSNAINQSPHYISSEKHRQSMQVTHTPLQIPNHKYHNSSFMPNQKQNNLKSTLDKPIQQQSQILQQQQQHQLLQNQQQQQQQQSISQQQHSQLQQQQYIQSQIQPKMISKPPTPKQIAQQSQNQIGNSNNLVSNQTSNSQNTQQPLKPIKPISQQKQNYLTNQSAVNRKDPSYFNFKFMNDGSHIQQQQIIQPKIKTNSSLKQFPLKSQTPQHINCNEYNNQAKLNQTQIHNNTSLLNSSFQQQNLLKQLESPEVGQLQKPLAKLTKKSNRISKPQIQLTSHQDLSIQENIQSHEKKESQSKALSPNQIIVNQLQNVGQQNSQNVNNENKETQQLHQEHQLVQTQQQNPQIQQIPQQNPSLSQTIVNHQNNNNNNSNIVSPHQHTHHHSAVIQKQSILQNQQVIAQSHHQVNLSVEYVPKKNNKNTTNSICNGQSSQNQQSSSSIQTESSPMNLQAFHSFNPQQQLNPQTYIKSQIQTHESTNTPQFSPAPFKQQPQQSVFEENNSKSINSDFIINETNKDNLNNKINKDDDRNKYLNINQQYYQYQTFNNIELQHQQPKPQQEQNE